MMWVLSRGNVSEDSSKGSSVSTIYLRKVIFSTCRGILHLYCKETPFSVLCNYRVSDIISTSNPSASFIHLVSFCGAVYENIKKNDVDLFQSFVHSSD